MMNGQSLIANYQFSIDNYQLAIFN